MKETSKTISLRLPRLHQVHRASTSGIYGVSRRTTHYGATHLRPRVCIAAPILLSANKMFFSKTVTARARSGREHCHYPPFLFAKPLRVNARAYFKHTLACVYRVIPNQRSLQVEETNTLIITHADYPCVLEISGFVHCAESYWESSRERQVNRILSLKRFLLIVSVVP